MGEELASIAWTSSAFCLHLTPQIKVLSTIKENNVRMLCKGPANGKIYGQVQTHVSNPPKAG
eukprot:7987132-Ditylum_brightwellii.AAC.1